MVKSEDFGSEFQQVGKMQYDETDTFVFESGTTVEATMHGRRQLKLARFDENYEMETPKLLIRILPIPGIEWVGNVRIKCKESGLEADLCFHKTNPFLGFGRNSRLVKGKIFCSNSLRTIYEIEGHWDR